MPYLCRVTISGPEPDADEVSQMTEAVASAIEAGWDAPLVHIGEDEDAEIPHDLPEDDGVPGGTILDYRVFGYPGGAIILVVLDGGDLAQTSVAIAGLARHLTSWSPGLLAYSPDEIKISKVDKPYDAGNWLPPVDEDEEDEPERPRWPLAGLLDDDLQEMAAAYLLALAVRSLWHPAEPVESRRARDVVLGAAEDPWGGELTGALGVMLIQAARLESGSGSFASLVVQGAGAPELAADLLQRARETGPKSETDGWTDDEMRGHVLVEGFVEDHQLLWDRVLDGESSSAYEDRSNRQLRSLLWAGLRAVATMADTLRYLSGPWQFLDALAGGSDTIVSIRAEQEEDQHEEEAEEDWEELESAAAALLVVWLAVRRPDLLDTPAGDSLVVQVIEDASSFPHVFHAAMVMIGSGPLKAALAERPAPDEVQAHIEDFVTALSATEGDHSDDPGDPYNDMYVALEPVLDDEPDRDEVVRYLLAVTGLAAKLTDTEANPNRNNEDYVSTPRMLTHHLLIEPVMHAVVTLHRHDDDDAVRARMLSLAAQVAPAAAGDLAAEFPGLTGEDPTLEPAARMRARRWIEKALRLANEYGGRAGAEADHACSADARALVRAVEAGQDLPADWPVERFVAAGAEAASAILHSVEEAGQAAEVFEED